jgi:hypothetical protein
MFKVWFDPSRRIGDDIMRAQKGAWTDDQLKQLAAIVASGGTAFRAAAKFKRSIQACQNQARLMGTPFAPLSTRRRNILEKCAAAERALGR